MKICKECNQDLPISNFTNSKQYKDGKCSKCNKCISIRSKKWREKTKVNRKYSLKTLYGITLEDYDILYQHQHCECVLCKRNDVKLFVDHDHETGEIRGLLCGMCNSGLGFLKDNIFILMRAVGYIAGITEYES